MARRGFYTDDQRRVRRVSEEKGLKRPKFPSEGIKHPGTLEKLGYNLEEGEEARQKALDSAEREYGFKETVDKLAALEGVNKGKPNHAKVKADIEYLQSKHKEEG